MKDTVGWLGVRLPLPMGQCTFSVNLPLLDLTYVVDLIYQFGNIWHLCL